MTRLPPSSMMVAGGAATTTTTTATGGGSSNGGGGGNGLRRTSSAEDFALAFGDVELHHLNNSTATAAGAAENNNNNNTSGVVAAAADHHDALMHEDSTDLDLSDFRDWWEAGAATGTMVGAAQQQHSLSNSPLPHHNNHNNHHHHHNAAVGPSAAPTAELNTHHHHHHNNNNNNRFRSSPDNDAQQPAAPTATATAIVDVSIVGELSTSTCPTTDLTTTTAYHQQQQQDAASYNSSTGVVSRATSFSRRDSNRSVASSSKMSSNGCGGSSCGFSTEDGGDCDDTASRSSVKRRRMTSQNTGANHVHLHHHHTTIGCFEPLERVRELVPSSVGFVNSAGGGDNDGNADGVRPWKVDIPDHDVVLGDTHEPTWGTKIYREVRKPYAKKTLTNEQLKVVKIEFQRRLEKDLGRKLACAPTFWCNKDNKTKIKHFSIAGFLKNRPGSIYAKAKDQAIKEDIKNASPRSRTRNAKLFTLKGGLDTVIDKALTVCNDWVGDDVDKELYAKGFKEDLERMLPWRADYSARKVASEQRAKREPILKGTHMREAKIHGDHVLHLETAFVDMVNSLGNSMVESHRLSKRSSIGPGGKNSSDMDIISVTSSNNNGSKNTASRKKPPRSSSSSSGGKGRSNSQGGSTASTARASSHYPQSAPLPEESTAAVGGSGMGIMAMMEEHRPVHEENVGGACLATVSSVTCSALSHNSTLPTHDHTANTNNSNQTTGGSSQQRPTGAPSHFDDSAAQDMDLSPINVRKAMLSQSLQNESVDERGLSMPSAQENNNNGTGREDGGGVRFDVATGEPAREQGNNRKDLSSMFSQTLRMDPVDHSLFEMSTTANIGSKISDVVVMPPGLPRDIQPGNAPTDELSVLSTPDDLSVLFMEARESAIRRGIDQPAALPRAGHVADRTKALLQQMGSKRNNTTTGKGT